MAIPRNDFGQLVRQGFGLGVGIWLAFAAIAAIVWVPLILLALVGALA